MSRESFQASLDELRDSVLGMGETVTARHRDAVTALEKQDRGLGQYVVDNDDEINERYLDIEADCIGLFALEQPVAGDLRFVAASFKIITDLERIADLATNIGQYVVDTETELVPRSELVAIGEAVGEMLDDALIAYAREDAMLCETLTERDEDIDSHCANATDRLFRNLLAENPSAPALEDLLADVNRQLLTIRDLERVGDHAVNIAARTYYLTEGDDALLY
ncbi:phosphate signaling complex protein PhoU [Salinibaculum rarum]|uniref:phosphate signaling complex protein PhoU n=1 Tax=Salinibaculum rarum TaxID=3058903 RepID=UPI00265FB299|nr:phosphate signaling complex protein PhoU [Salinibaculum sp. KK48]